jgi:uncharacterized membrane protein YoaT (DUF817 family)
MPSSRAGARENGVHSFWLTISSVTTLPTPRPTGRRVALENAGLFVWLHLRACIFAFSVFGTLALSHVTTLGLPRYDFILIVLLLVQASMYFFKLETLEEIKFITIFHLVGFVLEQFKTHVGSWAYPEFAYSKIAGVPLYSGFMYAAVGSYIAQAWRLLDIRLERAPRARWGWLLGIAIYLNFFTNAVLPDVRYALMAAVAALYWRTRIVFHVRSSRIALPLPLAFGIVGFMIWIAENIATFFGAWVYPNQTDGWRIVDFSKIWMLLVIIIFILVHHLKKKLGAIRA